MAATPAGRRGWLWNGTRGEGKSLGGEWLLPKRDGRLPKSNGLQPSSDGLQPSSLVTKNFHAVRGWQRLFSGDVRSDDQAVHAASATKLSSLTGAVYFEHQNSANRIKNQN